MFEPRLHPLATMDEFVDCLLPQEENHRLWMMNVDLVLRFGDPRSCGATLFALEPMGISITGVLSKSWSA
jgi:hypothetical protein